MRKNTMKKTLISFASLAMVINTGQSFASSAISDSIVSVTKSNSYINSQSEKNTYGKSDTQSILIGYMNAKGKELVRLNSLSIDEEFDSISAMAVTASSYAINLFKKDPNIVYVEANQIVKALSNDIYIGQYLLPSEGQGWDTLAVKSGDAHTVGLTGLGIKVAVLDTGISPHSELKIAGGVSMVNYTTDFADDKGHGTFVAGTIAAQEDNNGIVGVAPNVDLYAVKIMDQNGDSFLADVISGVDWSITNHMDIINLSMGSTTESTTFRNILEKAKNAGMMVVSSAGNSGVPSGVGDTMTYPGNYDSVVAVGAVGSSMQRASFSSTGNALDFVAPGEDIVSLSYTGGYDISSGTSYAAPQITGLLALYKQKYPTKSNDQLVDLLKSYSQDMGRAGYDPLYGYGFVSFSDTEDKQAPNEVVDASIVTKGTDFANLKWTNPTNPDYSHVNVYVDDVFVEKSTSGTYSLNNLKEITTYLVTLKSVDLLGNESAGFPISLTTDKGVDNTAPAEVTGLLVTAKDETSITIGFTNPSDVDFTKALIFVDGNWVGESTSGTYAINQLNADTSYTIVVKTVDALNNTSTGTSIQEKTNAVIVPPIVDNTAPAEVTGLSVTAKDETSITIGFTNPSDIDFEKALIFIDGNPLFVGESTDGTFVILNLNVDTSYTIIVKTVDALGNTSTGTSIQEKTNAGIVPPIVDNTAPAEVTGLSVTAKDETSITIGFTNPSDTDFEKALIFVNGNPLFVGESTDGTFAIPNLNADTSYTIIVKTVDALGNTSTGTSIQEKTNALIDPPVGVIPPAEVIGLEVNNKNDTSVTIGFTIPADTNFVKALIFVDGVLVGESTNGEYVIDRLNTDTSYTVVVKTVYVSGDVSVGQSIRVKTDASSTPPTTPTPPVDVSAPDEVSDLTVTSKNESSVVIKFVNPTDQDFLTSLIFVNGNKVGQTTIGQFLIKNLSSSTSYLITVKTMDILGNVSTGSVVTLTTEATTPSYIESPVYKPETPTYKPTPPIVEEVKPDTNTNTTIKPTVNFKDVSTHWSKDTVKWAVDRGIVNGYTDGTFKPNGKVTEAEFIAMLIRASNSVVDSEDGLNWSDKYYKIATELNIPIGKKTDHASNQITRLEVADIVASVRGYKYTGNNLIRFMYANGYSTGNNSEKMTIESFNSKGKLTRAEAIQFIKNLFDKIDGELLSRPKYSSSTSDLPIIAKK